MNDASPALWFWLAAALPIGFVALRVARDIRRILKRFEDPEELARLVAAHRRSLADDVPEGEEPDLRVVIGDRVFRWGDPPERAADGGAAHALQASEVAPPLPTRIGVGASPLLRPALTIAGMLLALFALRALL